MTSNPRPLDKPYATLILNSLLKPFETQKAYSLGIIDKTGKLIKTPETQEEKDSYNPFYQVVFGVKKIIDSFPGTKNNLKLLATSMNFIRQQVVPNQFNESIDYPMFLKELNLVIENDLCLVEEELYIEAYMSEEEGGAAPSGESTPTNSTENIDIHTPVINRMFKKKKVSDNG